MASITAYAGSVPAYYETYLGPILFEPYALDMVERLEQDQLHHVLELACGTGRVTRHLAEAMGNAGKLYATDINPDMINVGKQQVDHPLINWQVVDAQDLPFEDESFSHIICQFGVMFFPDKLLAFKEAYRSLKKGGKLLFSVWDSLDHNPRSALIRKVMTDMMGAEAPDFLERGPYSFFDQEEISNLVMEAGFEHVSIHTVKKETQYSDPNEIILGFVDGSPLSAYLDRKEPALREELVYRLGRELELQFDELGWKVPLQAIVIETMK